MLNRSLLGLRDLISHSLDDVRMANNAPRRQPLLLSTFIEEVRNAASLDASVRGITLVVSPVAAGLTIDADRQVLAAVLGNLLQNAFKFTRPDSTVTVSVKSSDERVLLEVHDECGRLYARNLPGTGCAFTIDLPRSSVALPAPA